MGVRIHRVSVSPKETKGRSGVFRASAVVDLSLPMKELAVLVGERLEEMPDFLIDLVSFGSGWKVLAALVKPFGKAKQIAREILAKVTAEISNRMPPGRIRVAPVRKHWAPEIRVEPSGLVRFRDLEVKVVGRPDLESRFAMENEEFWDDFTFLAEAGMDHLIQDRDMDGDYFNSVRNLLGDEGDIFPREVQNSGGIELPVPAGTRVAFNHEDLEAVLTYSQIPNQGVEGTVVKVKAANGKGTYADTGHVFVKWDDGRFMPTLASHLHRAPGTKRVAKGVVLRVAEIGSLSNFFTASGGSGDELIHKATKDLWSFRQDESGYVIERLFDFSGDPLKV